MVQIGRSKIGMIGIPLGFAAGTVGCELGIEAMRLSKIRDRLLADHIADLGRELVDHGDIPIVKPSYHAPPEENPKYLAEMLASSKTIFDAVRAILANDEFPLILGGDHSIAIGTFSAISSYFAASQKDIGLIWFDAHADINTPESSITGNIHGMPLAALLGEGSDELVNLGGHSPKVKPQYLAHVGARDLDQGERDRVLGLGLRDNFFTMSDIDLRGMPYCVERALKIAGSAPGGFAVTFDVDAIDPRFAPGSGTLVRGGLNYREAHLALEMIAASGQMRSFEIVEVNPLLDQSNITVELACELILSALGKTIL